MSSSSSKRDRAIAGFKVWLAARGAEVLAPTNEWEVVRFQSSAGVSVIYAKKTGALTFTNESRAAWDAFERGEEMRFAKRAPRLTRRSPVVQTLLGRDGPRCFYCDAEFCDDLPPTKEHLVPRTAGGPDHVANLFLACEPCNREAGHLLAVEKIKLRDRKRAAAPVVPPVLTPEQIRTLTHARHPGGSVLEKDPS